VILLDLGGVQFWSLSGFCGPWCSFSMVSDRGVSCLLSIFCQFLDCSALVALASTFSWHVAFGFCLVLSRFVVVLRPL
jgi:hypothetical protein